MSEVVGNRWRHGPVDARTQPSPHEPEHQPAPGGNREVQQHGSDVDGSLLRIHKDIVPGERSRPECLSALSIYSRVGGLPQGPHPGAESRLVPDVFALPAHLSAKTSAALIDGDRARFASITACLDQQIVTLSDRIDELRRAPGRRGRGAMDRDEEIHRVSARRATLQRYGNDICIGRMTEEGRSEPTYLGRIGLTDPAGRQLLLDWRTPAAAPFFAATPAHRLGLVSRRRYRWAEGRIVDYWDEAFTLQDADAVALDEDSAFLLSLGASRTGHMRDVVGTIQADQDAIIRASSEGVVVVDGGPGTGKTVVGLHRAAYLLYADARLQGGRGDLLVVGPHRPYLNYIADVLPALGEEGVATCTLADLVPEGATAGEEPDPQIARLKNDARMASAVEPAVSLYEEPPTEPFDVATAWDEVRITPQDWADAFTAAPAGVPHNEARDDVWEALMEIVLDRHDQTDASEDEIRSAMTGNLEFARTFSRAWPILDAADLVSDLWDVPAYLKRCAPWLTASERHALARPEGSAWTGADLPLLDAMRHRVGDPAEPGRRRHRESGLAAQRAYMDDLVDYLLATDDDPDSGLQLLRRASIRDDLVDEDAVATRGGDRLAGPFAHLVVDEAQELTDAQWQMLLRRCPSRSMTVVGDRAQARAGFTESWSERLARVGVGRLRHATLTVNYRTPAEVMAEAEPVIRAVLPDASVPQSIRRSGRPVQHGNTKDLAAIVEGWLGENPQGTACVIGAPAFASTPRVRSLAPDQVAGLEFDLVVLVDPERFGLGDPVAGAVERYVAMTRTTQHLVVLTS